MLAVVTWQNKMASCMTSIVCDKWEIPIFVFMKLAPIQLWKICSQMSCSYFHLSTSNWIIRQESSCVSISWTHFALPALTTSNSDSSRIYARHLPTLWITCSKEICTARAISLWVEDVISALPCLAIRANIIIGCKYAKSYVEERGKKRENPILHY